MKKQIFESSGFSKISLIILATIVFAGILGGIFYLQMQEIQPAPPKPLPSQPSTSTAQPQDPQLPSTALQLQ